jgi:hypothetical protein
VVKEGKKKGAEDVRDIIIFFVSPSTCSSLNLEKPLTAQLNM